MLKETDLVQYALSGKCPRTGSAAALTAALVTGSSLGAAYAYCLDVSPLVYGNLLVACMYGLVHGWVTGAVAKAVHVRSIPLVLAVTVVSSLTGLYVHWACYVFMLSGLTEIIIQPAGLLAVLAKHANSGRRSVAGYDLQGVALYVMWTGELLLIIGTSLFSVYRYYRQRLYCEHCGKWVTGKEVITHIEKIGQDEIGSLRNDLQQRNIAQLLLRNRVAPGSSAYCMVELYRCEACCRFHVMTVKNVTERDNGLEKVDLTIALHIEINPVLYHALLYLRRPGPYSMSGRYLLH